MIHWEKHLKTSLILSVAFKNGSGERTKRLWRQQHTSYTSSASLSVSSYIFPAITHTLTTPHLTSGCSSLSPPLDTVTDVISSVMPVSSPFPSLFNFQDSNNVNTTQSGYKERLCYGVSLFHFVWFMIARVNYGVSLSRVVIIWHCFVWLFWERERER